MKQGIILSALCAFVCLTVAFTEGPEEAPSTPLVTLLSSEIAFDKMMNVLTHPRCMNCHPSGDNPRQGNESRIHDFDVSRVTNCQSCHQDDNNPYSGVPGAHGWALAPQSMAWEGLSRRQIAEALLDKSKNGGRDHEALVHHLTEHELVLWAWKPGLTPAGDDREPVPVSLEEYREAVHAWFDQGAVIPQSEK